MDAATFQVMMNLKIGFTALLMLGVLGRRLSGRQWGALIALTAGVVCVQMEGWLAVDVGQRHASVTGFAIVRVRAKRPCVGLIFQTVGSGWDLIFI